MSIIRSLSRGVALAGAVATGGALVVTARSVLATPQPLESALEGESHIFRFREGDIFYKVRGPADAQPVLFLHGIHIAASSFEWRRNFSVLGQNFRVYAPDLPGFGLSDRPAIEYTAELYDTLITDFVREVIRRPTMIVARGQSAAFTTRAAYLDPHLFSRLVFISPSGITVRPAARQEEQDKPGTALRQTLQRMSETTIGQVPYAFLTTKLALSLFIARQSYANPELVTPDLVRYLFATTHQYGARYAPLAFMTGKLDRNVATEFAQLQQPVLLVWGEHDAINDPLHAETLRRLNPHARLELIPQAGNAVQEEQAPEINELLRAWFMAPPELIEPASQTMPPAHPTAPPSLAETASTPAGTLAPAELASTGGMQPPGMPMPQAEAPAIEKAETEAPAAQAMQPEAHGSHIEPGKVEQPEISAQPPLRPEAEMPATMPQPAERAGTAPTSAEAPTDETPPAAPRLAAEPSPEAQAAALGEVSPEATKQPDLTLPGGSTEESAVAPGIPIEPTHQEETTKTGAAPGTSDQTEQAATLLAETEAQAATEMLGQLPATEQPVAPPLEQEGPAASGQREATPETTQAPGVREFSPEGTAAAHAPAALGEEPATGTPHTPPQEAAATGTAESPAPPPPMKAAQRRPAPKPSGSRAARPGSPGTSGKSRSSGSKKKK